MGTRLSDSRKSMRNNTIPQEFHLILVNLQNRYVFNMPVQPDETKKLLFSEQLFQFCQG
jgi:hypothetical protein